MLIPATLLRERRPPRSDLTAHKAIRAVFCSAAIAGGVEGVAIAPDAPDATLHFSLYPSAN
jgi:hypothetical protein